MAVNVKQFLGLPGGRQKQKAKTIQFYELYYRGFFEGSSNTSIFETFIVVLEWVWIKNFL